MTAPLTFRDRAVTFFGKTQHFPNRNVGGGVMTPPYRGGTLNNNLSYWCVETTGISSSRRDTTTVHRIYVWLSIRALSMVLPMV